MITIILDGLVLLGLMFLFDRKNPNRDFLETGLVAFILVIASALMNSFLTPLIGLVVLLPYFALCVFLLWKLPEIAIRRAVVIAAVFVAFKIVEPFVFRALLGS
ncbi:MAG: hypothetical protein AUH75_10220 [Gemmatimonadetes bacterium 13_1_40CM_4_65_7]|nr:MAG: hypothetical protein AUH75_10220 [Gemmatimonadetes bacterium 13_1_40CM_4_65_7]